MKSHKSRTKFISCGLFESPMASLTLAFHNFVYKQLMSNCYWYAFAFVLHPKFKRPVNAQPQIVLSRAEGEDEEKNKLEEGEGEEEAEDTDEEQIETFSLIWHEWQNIR